MMNAHLPRRTYVVVAGYGTSPAGTADGEAFALVAGALLQDDDGIRLSFREGNPFRPGQRITLHLDDRTGAEVFDSSLRVHRGSCKAVVAEAGTDWLLARPEEYDLKFSSRTVALFKAPGWDYPAETRPERALPETELTEAVFPDEKERENKLGVWITRTEQRPHTTVMAFLSSRDDDVFVISHAGTFKSANIHRDRRCLFAIDHRATFLFEKAYTWNFTIVRAEAYAVSRSNPLFLDLQTQFVDKNPWEIAFFTDPKVELFHLKPLGLVCPGDLRA